MQATPIVNSSRSSALRESSPSAKPVDMGGLSAAAASGLRREEAASLPLPPMRDTVAAHATGDRLVSSLASSIAGESSALNGSASAFLNPLDEVPASAMKRRSIAEPQQFTFQVPTVAAPPYCSDDGANQRDEESRFQSLAMAGGREKEDHPVDEVVVVLGSSTSRTMLLDDMPAVARGTPLLPEGTAEVRAIQLEHCPHCSRTFALDRLEKHVAVCEKHQDGEKKPKTDRLAKRAPKTKNGSSRSAAGGADGAVAGAHPEKWRRQSAQLRKALRGVAQADDDRVPCPGCGRRFAADVAARHTPLCSAKQVRA